MNKVVLTITGTITAIALSTVLVPIFLPGVSPLVINAQSSRQALSSEPMTAERLKEIVNEIATDVREAQNQILFDYEDKTVLLVADAQADRMRLVIPIIEADELTGEQMGKMMLANFHTALDGRYAIGNGVVYAAYVHPLSSLQDSDFRSAVQQVTELSKSFGTTYSSGTALFGAPRKTGGDATSLPEI